MDLALDEAELDEGENHDEADEEVWRWLIERAFPVKWGMTDLDAGAAQILVESVEFAHEGIRKG